MSDTATTPSSDEVGSMTSDEDQKKLESDEGNLSSKDENSPGKSDVAVEDESLQDSCKTMFKNISEYLQSELSASLEDYDLLEKLNGLTREKYSEMDNITNSLTGRMKVINEKYTELQPYLEMIEKVDASVTNLEQAAYKLDTYSKELEARFKKLEKIAS